MHHMGQSSRYEQKPLATHYTSCCGMSASSELYAMNYGDHCLTPVPTCRCLSSWGQAQERVSNCDPRGGGRRFLYLRMTTGAVVHHVVLSKGKNWQGFHLSLAKTRWVNNKDFIS